MRKAFSLVELLVVIAILGILITIVTANFGGARESARALQCLSNLRDLASAATAIAMETKLFPSAGSQWVRATDGSILQDPAPGWISWGEHNDPVPFNGTGVYENDIFAITNGGGKGFFWNAVKHNRRVYKCPTFVRDYNDASHKEPLYTYVMNGAAFRYDWSKGMEEATTDWQQLSQPNLSSGVYYSGFKRSDRVLMFAELPHPTRSGVKMAGDPYLGDSILQTDATIQGKHYGIGANWGYWPGTPESIGFVHKTNAGKYCAHVVFADGHVEKIAEPVKGKGLTPEEITAVLCAGDDYAYDQNGYRLVSKADEEAARGEASDE